ncbi:MAG: hypothetical protein WBV39_14785 [Rudaea sp.]
MNPFKCGLTLGALLLAGCAAKASGGSGMLYAGGKPYPLVGAYAYRYQAARANSAEALKASTVIVLSDKPIDAAALDQKQQFDMPMAVRRELDDKQATAVVMYLNPDASLQRIETLGDELHDVAFGDACCTLTIKRNDDKRVEGSLRSNNAAGKTEGEYFDLHFALSLPPAETPLPADGGEAFKAYLNYAQALAKGDIAAMAKSMTRKDGDQLLVDRKRDNFKTTLDYMQFVALQNPQFVSGSFKGDRATLTLRGTHVDASAGTGAHATMRRENGAWRFVDQTTD